MPEEIMVQDGLAPYHFAGMVYNPSKSALNSQAQRLLLIGRYEPKEGEAPGEGLQQITSLNKIAEIYPNSESEIVKMLKASFEANPMVERYAIAVTDKDSIKPSWEFSFSETGEEIKDGSLLLGICGLDPINVEFKASEFAEKEGENEVNKTEVLIAKIKKTLDRIKDLGYKTEQKESKLTLTCSRYIDNGNHLSLGVELDVPGFSVKRTAFKAGFKASRSLSEALSKLPEMQFTQIASSFNSKEDIILANEELERRWGPTLQLDGHYFTAIHGSVNKIKETYSDNGNVLDELKHVTVMGVSDSNDSSAVWAASLAAVNSLYALKPYLPYHSLPLPGVTAPETEYTLAQRDMLLKLGISTHVVESGKAKIDRLVSMHSKDWSYRDLNKKQILSYLRYDFVKFLKSMYPRSALSKDDTQADGDVATPKSARDLAIARHMRWKQEKFVQDPDGDFKNNVDVRVDENNGETLRFFLPVQLMGQMRRTVTTIAFTP